VDTLEEAALRGLCLTVVCPPFISLAPPLHMQQQPTPLPAQRASTRAGRVVRQRDARAPQLSLWRMKAGSLVLSTRISS